MKTAISIADDLFHEIEVCARYLKVWRSRFFAVAAREFLTRHATPSDATAAWDRAISKAGQPSDEPGAHALQERSRLAIRASATQWR